MAASFSIRGALRRIAVIGAALVWITVFPAPSAPAETRIVPASDTSTRLPVWAAQQASGHDLSRLRIPAIGMDEIIREGVAQEVIDAGVAHWVGTASPGGAGNMVLAGHRTTFTSPFRDLDRLHIDDHIYVATDHGFDAIYVVADTFVVEPTDVWITYDTAEPVLTMFACHPKGSVAQRIVVRAELLADGRIG